MKPPRKHGPARFNRTPERIIDLSAHKGTQGTVVRTSAAYLQYLYLPFIGCTCKSYIKPDDHSASHFCGVISQGGASMRIEYFCCQRHSSTVYEVVYGAA
ncbi:hypothetical protein CDAR_565641 [Caerostris darwini]|uniref:Uncharacterized protein n=1 Tax=Caerostris darwini TaxID=1538125 RepID=A0AAV4UYF0_9ARAC|nr:hypothetical protein CDAR_565641 [Caerostris darwini]